MRIKKFESIENREKVGDTGIKTYPYKIRIETTFPVYFISDKIHN